MKRHLILAFIFTIGFSLSAQAQFGKLKVKAPKVKVKNPISKKSSSSSSSSNSSGGSASELAKTKKIENETAELMDVVKAIFASKDASNQKSTKEIEDALYKVKSKISTLTNYYKLSQRVDEFQTDYDKYSKMAKAEFALRETVNDVRYSLKMENKWAEAAKADFSASNFVSGNGGFPKYEEFKKDRATYKAGGKPEAELDGFVSNIENYFDNTLAEKSADVRKYMIEGVCEKAFDKTKWESAPKAGIDRIEFQLDKVETMYVRVKNSEWIDALKKEMLAQKAVLEKYISSGEYDKYKAAVRKKRVDARRMDKPHKKDGAMEALVKKYHTTSKYGTLKRVIITSDWYVKKNDLGIPLEKKMRVQVATTKDGECVMRDGYLFKTYEGGGRYGKIQLSFYSNPYEINCANTFK